MLRIREYRRVESLEEAYELNQKKTNRIIGGGLWMKIGDRNLMTAIDLSGLGLDQISETEDEFVIGCMATLRDLEVHPGLNAYTDGAVKQSVCHIVGVQFRNCATVGGSIYGRFGFSDVLTLFAALDCYVELYKGGNVPIQEFTPALGMDGPYYTEATVGLFAGLDLDLWGVHRSAVAAAIGAHNAALAETAAVELSLTTGVAQLYYSMQASYQMLDLLEQTRDVIDYAVKAHQSKVAHGLEAQVPFHGARAQILAVDKQIAAVKGQITETRESLRALIGAGASDMPEIKPVALPRVQTGIPATLSYELLARRPDLQAMRWYVQASLDQVDSARALFYPSFDIKAFFGLDSIHLDTLFKKTSRQFNFIPGLKLPLFDGGRLNANLEGTRAASNMMIERYNQSVLNAVRDVAVNGTRLQTLNDEREMQAERVEATRFTQRAAEAAYQRGLTSRLQATEARLPVLAEEMSLLMLDSRRVIQSIQLMKSLGGGYQASPVVEKK